jgi:hypothetical protein
LAQDRLDQYGLQNFLFFCDLGWLGGIIGGSQTTISNNTVALSPTAGGSGIETVGANVSGNIVTGMGDTGIVLTEGGTVTSNTTVGNGIGVVADDNLGTAEQNNIVGNGCGVYAAVADFNAENNYWGAATGPGSTPPADGVCTGSASVLTGPYATVPFKVSVKLVP